MQKNRTKVYIRKFVLKENVATMRSLYLSRPENLKDEHAYGLEVTASYSPYKWWRLNTDLNFLSYFCVSGEVQQGIVNSFPFQSDVTSLRFSWTGFEADMEIVNYYAGVSLQFPAFDNETRDCSFFMYKSQSVFDVSPLEVGLPFHFLVES